MANAEIIPPEPQDPQVQLTLTEQEALTLLNLTAFVSGGSEDTYRGHTDDIGNALARAMPVGRWGDGDMRFSGTVTAQPIR